MQFEFDSVLGKCSIRSQVHIHLAAAWSWQLTSI